MDSDQNNLQAARRSQNMLAPDNTETNDEYKPTDMEKLFTMEEVKKAAQSLKNTENNKSPPIDDLPAAFTKYAPGKTHQEIADILNQLASTGEVPEEIELGILNHLPKPGKAIKPGSAEHLHPIILLSVLHKILTIYLIKRTWEKFQKFIPVEQAAYQHGHSTTKEVFTIKMLAGKAINSSDYEIHLFLDISKAFDTADRQTLFENLEKILAQDELHLLLTRHPKIQVRLNDNLGERCTTLVENMQGDVLSAILFILCLAACLGREKKAYLNKLVFAPKFADDITNASDNKQRIEEIKRTMPGKLQAFNLTTNESKKEVYFNGRTHCSQQ